MLDKIITIAKETFSDEGLNADSKLEDAKGFDSMALVQFIIELESNLDMEIKDEDIDRTFTLVELEVFLKKQAEAK